MTDSRQTWLESLDPRVRAEVEAEIAFYEDPDNYEYVEDDDWEPNPNFTTGLTVEFTREEIHLLRKAFDPQIQMFTLMHDMLLERAHAILAERGDPKSNTVAAD